MQALMLHRVIGKKSELAFLDGCVIAEDRNFGFGGGDHRCDAVGRGSPDPTITNPFPIARTA